MRRFRSPSGGDVLPKIAAVPSRIPRCAVAGGVSRRRFAHRPSSRNRRRRGGDGKSADVVALLSTDRRYYLSANAYSIRWLFRRCRIRFARRRPDPGGRGLRQQRRLPPRDAARPLAGLSARPATNGFKHRWSAGGKTSSRAQSGAVAVDMESAAVARITSEAGVPFACLRAISDDADTYLPESLLAVLEHGGVRPARLMAAIVPPARADRGVNTASRPYPESRAAIGGRSR